MSSDALYAGADRRWGETSPNHASLPAGSVLSPAPSGDSTHGVRLVLDARTVLPGELYQFGTGLQPGILILGADLSAWGDLPARLAEAGFVVLVLEVEVTAQASKIELMLQSLIAIRGVDAGALGVMGELAAADLALLGCAVNSLCDALALFSPVSRGTLLNMMPSYGARPLLLAAGRSDLASRETVEALHGAALGPSLVLEAGDGRGAGLLRAQPELENQLVAWFKRQLVKS